MPVLTREKSPPIATTHGRPERAGRIPRPGPGELWWVIKTIPNHERAATQTLHELRVSYFSPMRPTTIRSAGRQHEGQAALFPGFLFLLCTEATLAYKVLRSPSLYNHLVARGGRRACVIDVGDPHLPRRRRAEQRHLHSELQVIATALHTERRRLATINAPRTLTKEERDMLTLSTQVLGGMPVLHSPMPPARTTDKITLTVKILGQAVDLVTTPARLLQSKE